jgi:type I restriction enzyme S subunit
MSLCDRVISGGTPKSDEASYYTDGTIPWLRTQEVTFNRIYDTDIKINENGLNNSNAKWVKENSVIVAMYGNSAGRTAIAKIPLTTNQACCNLEINPNKADYNFIYYKLLSEFEALKGLSKGAAQNNLNANDVKEFPIALPILPTQRKIANHLIGL